MSDRHVSILGWLTFSLSVVVTIVSITLYVTEANAEQDRLLAEHEVRLHAVEEGMKEIKSQRSLLEKILEVVTKERTKEE